MMRSSSRAWWWLISTPALEQSKTKIEGVPSLYMYMDMYVCE